MSSRPAPAAAPRCCRRDPAGLLALLAAFFVLFQLPGPATCSKLDWQFAAVALEATDSEEPQSDEARAAPEAVEAGMRFDQAAADARAKAAQASELHAQGKHAAAEAAAKEGPKALGM